MEELKEVAEWLKEKGGVQVDDMMGDLEVGGGLLR